MRNGYWRFGKRRIAIFLVLVLVVALLCLPASFSRGTARATDQPGTRPGEHSKLVCGFDAYGADEALSQHELNRLLATGGKNSRQVAGPLPQVQTAGNIAVIEDDGSIIMQPRKFNLNNSALLFTADGDGYLVSTGDIAFSKNYGTRLQNFLGPDEAPLSDANNGYQRVSLEGSPFTFFGIQYNEIFVGTNGYVTFTKGDTTGRISAAALAKEVPRLAPLWADLDVTNGGAVYYNRLADRLLVTWDHAPQAQYSELSTFQLALFNDGRIAFIYKKVKARNALVGISPGGSTDNAQPMDFANAQGERITQPVFESFSKQKRLDIPALTQAFYAAEPDAFDTLFIWTDFAFDNGPGYATSFVVRNDIKGIGVKQFDKGGSYGSAAHLSSLSIMGDIVDNWPDDPNANVVGLFSGVAIVCHEQGHRWLVYVKFKSNNSVKDDLLGRDFTHWSFLMDTRSTPDGNFSSLMEGNVWSETSGTSFRSSEESANYFSELDQYLMGLRNADEVHDLNYLDVGEPLQSSLRIVSPATNIALAANKKTATMSQIIAQEGERVPDAAHAPKEFRFAFILLTERGLGATSNAVNRAEAYRSALERYFSLATARRGALNGSLSQN